MKMIFGVLACLGLFACKFKTHDTESDTSAVVKELPGHRFQMLSAKFYDSKFNLIKEPFFEKVSGHGNQDFPDHICFFETKWIYNPKGETIQNIIQPQGFIHNPFDQRKLTTPLSENTIDFDSFSKRYFSTYNDQFRKARDKFRSDGFQVGAGATALSLILLSFLAEGGTGGLATFAASLTVPSLAAISGAGASIGWKAGDFVFHAQSNGLKIATNMGAVQDPRILNVKDKNQFFTETDYDQLKKLVITKAKYFKDVGKPMRKCESLLPKDDELRAILREYSTTTTLDRAE